MSRFVAEEPMLKTVPLFIGVLFIGCSTAPVAPPRAGPDYDLVLVGGRVVDGTGAPWFRADVGISGDKIAAVGDLSAATAGRRIDVRERMVGPGFIDLLGQSELNVLVDNRAESKIRQGITTEITGEGSSVAPLNDVLLSELWMSPREAITFICFLDSGGPVFRVRWVASDPRDPAIQRLQCVEPVRARGHRLGAQLC
jgi:hypothetical protein